MKILRDLVRRNRLYQSYRSWRRKKKQIRAIAEWKNKGRPVPPPHVIKQMTVRNYGRRYGLGLFVETGTKYGDMLLGLEDNFDRICSIELSEELVERARNRFARCPHIELIQGDSGRELADLLKRIDRAALFWLDSHFAGAETAKGDSDTPILAELDGIFASPDRGHVVLIDDARYFGTDPDYPTLEELESFIRARRNNVDVRVRHDSIRITPRKALGSSRTGM